MVNFENSFFVTEFLLTESRILLCEFLLTKTFPYCYKFMFLAATDFLIRSQFL